MSYIDDLAEAAKKEMAEKRTEWAALPLDTNIWSQRAIKGLAEDVTLSENGVFASPCTAFALRHSGRRFNFKEEVKRLIPRPDPSDGILIALDPRFHAFYHGTWFIGGRKRETFNHQWVRTMIREKRYTREFGAIVLGALDLDDANLILGNEYE
jgi:hypothetical protein